MKIRYWTITLITSFSAYGAPPMIIGDSTKDLTINGVQLGSAGFSPSSHNVLRYKGNRYDLVTFNVMNECVKGLSEKGKKYYEEKNGKVFNIKRAYERFEHTYRNSLYISRNLLVEYSNSRTDQLRTYILNGRIVGHTYMGPVDDEEYKSFLAKIESRYLKAYKTHLALSYPNEDGKYKIIRKDTIWQVENPVKVSKTQTSLTDEYLTNATPSNEVGEYVNFEDNKYEVVLEGKVLYFSMAPDASFASIYDDNFSDGISYSPVAPDKFKDMSVIYEQYLQDSMFNIVINQAEGHNPYLRIAVFKDLSGFRNEIDKKLGACIQYVSNELHEGL